MNSSCYDQSFEGVDFRQGKEKNTQFENCQFHQCQFNEMKLIEWSFLECSFTECDFSLCHLHKTAWKDVQFFECKLMGVNFSLISPFLLQMYFDKCLLHHTLFENNVLKNTHFHQCELIEANFTNCNLAAAQFPETNLDRAIFSNCNLAKADFSSAYHYQIDPDDNQMKQAIFSKDGLAGLLSKYQLSIAKD